MKSFADERVAAVFDAYPESVRLKLLALRKLIFATAAKTDGVGELEETLKWGQPSYLTPATRSGSTIRIDGIKNDDARYAVYFTCHTNLVDRFRELYRDQLRFEGNRSIVLDVKRPLPAKKPATASRWRSPISWRSGEGCSPQEAKRNAGRRSRFATQRGLRFAPSRLRVKS